MSPFRLLWASALFVLALSACAQLPSRPEVAAKPAAPLLILVSIDGGRALADAALAR